MPAERQNAEGNPACEHSTQGPNSDQYQERKQSTSEQRMLNGRARAKEKAVVLLGSGVMFIVSLIGVLSVLFIISMVGGKLVFVAASFLFGPSFLIPHILMFGIEDSGTLNFIYFGVIGISVPVQNTCYCMLAGWPFRFKEVRLLVFLTLFVLVLIHIFCGIAAILA